MSKQIRRTTQPTAETTRSRYTPGSELQATTRMHSSANTRTIACPTPKKQNEFSASQSPANGRIAPSIYAPPPAANVVGAVAGGNVCTLTFDQPMVLVGGPGPIVPDDAIVFDDGSGPVAATSVQNAPGDWYTLQFAVPDYLGSGATWAITRQPVWITTAVAWPAGGTF